MVNKIASINPKIEYKKKTEKQLIAWFKSKEKSGTHKFTSKEDFLEWYSSQKDKKCFYCGLTERDSQEIVMRGLLKSNRFPENGVLKRGRNRGVWLEIDRKRPKGPYSRENCVLACYFCNNDKSDVFETAEEYLKFRDNGLEYLKDIIKENEN